MDLIKKLEILADSAKYDAACTSSGANRKYMQGAIGSTVTAGCCHSFSADGRCISLLKVLYSNYCIYDCKYCVNRASADVPRTAFTPEELAELTIEFYRRNYIEGLFLSSGVMHSPDYTMERMIRALELLRYKHRFAGYIHAKAIPGASGALIERIGLVADRLSVNIELPSEKSLKRLAPNKSKQAILAPMGKIKETIAINNYERAHYKNAPHFAGAGQATQMIIGATPESDFHILKLASGLYQNYGLKRIFYSAYVPAVEDTLLPSPDNKPPLLREHRLYQADFLMRKYEFAAEEILSESAPDFNPYMDPKCNWAVNNMHFFPVDVNAASRETLLRVPGIGPVSAGRIIAARRAQSLGIEELKRLGVVMKRARYFIIARDQKYGMKLDRMLCARALVDKGAFSFGTEQLSLFSSPAALAAPHIKTLTEAAEEAALCMAR